MSEIGGALEELAYHLQAAIALIVGLVIVWVLGPAIRTARIGRRAATLRGLAPAHWIAYVVALLTAFFSSAFGLIPAMRSPDVLVWFAPFDIMLSPWTPAILAILGGLLVVTPRLAAGFSSVFASVGLLLSLDWDMLFTPGMRGLAFLGVGSEIQWVLGLLVCLWTGGLVYWAWERRQPVGVGEHSSAGAA